MILLHLCLKIAITIAGIIYTYFVAIISTLNTVYCGDLPSFSPATSHGQVTP